MQRSTPFGIFVEDNAGPLCAALVDDLEEAKRNARNLAEKDEREHFIFDFSCSAEVTRFFPPGHAKNQPASRGLSEE